MARKRYKPEEIVSPLRQAEVLHGQQRRHVQCLLVAAVALGLVAVRTGVVRRREEPGPEQFRELVRLERAVHGHRRQGTRLARF